MESKERMLLEGVLGAVLITFLVLASIMIVSAYRDGEQETTITNSYNTNSYNTNSFNTNPSQTARSAYTTGTQKKIVYSKPYIVDRRDYAADRRGAGRRDYSMVYYIKDDSRYSDTKSYSDDRYLRYDDFGNFRTYSGIVGNRVDNYEVYIRNREYTGGYFETTFYFEDYYGNIDSKSMTYYVPAREEKTFVFRDVSPPDYKYRTWRYDVVPLTKMPTKTYYNDDMPYRMMYSDRSQQRAYSYSY